MINVTDNTLNSFFAPSSVKWSLTRGYKQTKKISNSYEKLQVVAVTYERWSLTCVQDIPNIFELEAFGFLENWSLRRGDCLRDMVKINGRFDYRKLMPKKAQISHGILGIHIDHRMGGL